MKTNMKRLMVGLVCAVLMGLVGSAMAQRGDNYGNSKRRGNHGRHTDRAIYGSKDGFSNKIYRVTQADSLQEKKMKPIVDRTSKRLATLRLSYQRQEKRVMDSLVVQLKPILKEEQMKRLEDYNYHAQDRASRKR